MLSTQRSPNVPNLLAFSLLPLLLLLLQLIVVSHGLPTSSCLSLSSNSTSSCTLCIGVLEVDSVDSPCLSSESCLLSTGSTCLSTLSSAPHCKVEQDGKCTLCGSGFTEHEGKCVDIITEVHRCAVYQRKVGEVEKCTICAKGYEVAGGGTRCQETQQDMCEGEARKEDGGCEVCNMYGGWRAEIEDEKIVCKQSNIDILQELGIQPSTVIPLTNQACSATLTNGKRCIKCYGQLSKDANCTPLKATDKCIYSELTSSSGSEPLAPICVWGRGRRPTGKGLEVESSPPTSPILNCFAYLQTGNCALCDRGYALQIGVDNSTTCVKIAANSLIDNCWRYKVAPMDSTPTCETCIRNFKPSVDGLQCKVGADSCIGSPDGDEIEILCNECNVPGGWFASGSVAFKYRCTPGYTFDLSTIFSMSPATSEKRIQNSKGCIQTAVKENEARCMMCYGSLTDKGVCSVTSDCLYSTHDILYDKSICLWAKGQKPSQDGKDLIPIENPLYGCIAYDKDENCVFCKQELSLVQVEGQKPSCKPIRKKIEFCWRYSRSGLTGQERCTSCKPSYITTEDKSLCVLGDQACVAGSATSDTDVVCDECNVPGGWYASYNFAYDNHCSKSDKDFDLMSSLGIIPSNAELMKNQGCAEAGSAITCAKCYGIIDSTVRCKPFDSVNNCIYSEFDDNINQGICKWARGMRPTGRGSELVGVEIITYGCVGYDKDESCVLCQADYALSTSGICIQLSDEQKINHCWAYESEEDGVTQICRFCATGYKLSADKNSCSLAEDICVNEIPISKENPTCAMCNVPAGWYAVGLAEKGSTCAKSISYQLETVIGITPSSAPSSLSSQSTSTGTVSDSTSSTESNTTTAVGSSTVKVGLTSILIILCMFKL